MLFKKIPSNTGLVKKKLIMIQKLHKLKIKHLKYLALLI